MKIDLKEIKVRYDKNARSDRSYKDEAFISLKEDIKNNGLIEPVVVAVIDGSYTLIAGHRRYTAILELFKEGCHDGLIPAVVDQTVKDGKDLTEAILFRQLQNKQFTVTEKAFAFISLRESGKSDSEISETTGFKPNYIAKIASIYPLIKDDEVLAEQVDKGEVTVDVLEITMRALGSYPSSRDNILLLLKNWGSLPSVAYRKRLDAVTRGVFSNRASPEEARKEALALVSKPLGRMNHVFVENNRQSDEESKPFELTDEESGCKYGNLTAIDPFDGLSLRSEEEIKKILKTDLRSYPTEVAYVINFLFTKGTE